MDQVMFNMVAELAKRVKELERKVADLQYEVQPLRDRRRK